jgi:hypothetical protein
MIAGSVGSIITMSMHPTARQLFAPGQLESVGRLNTGVHVLAMACVPVLFLAALGLSRHLKFSDRKNIAGLVVYGFALVSVLLAAAFSGLVTLGIAHHMQEASAASMEAWHVALAFNGHLNQAFALIFAVGSAVALLLWSISIVRSRLLPVSLGIYGCILGPITILGVFSGHLKMNVHGMGMLVLAQAIWYISAGVMLWQAKEN